MKKVIMIIAVRVVSANVQAASLKTNDSRHFSGSSGFSMSRGSALGGYPRQRTCTKNTYLIRQYTTDVLEQIPDPDRKKYCDLLHSRTCGLPVVSFLTTGERSGDNRTPGSLDHQTYWYQTTQEEVFVEKPGYTGCRVWRRIGGEMVLNAETGEPEPKTDNAVGQRPEDPSKPVTNN